MSITGHGNDWEYGPLDRRIQDTCYVDIGSLPEYREYLTPHPASPEDAPYPAFYASHGYEVHLPPRLDHIIVMLVDEASRDVLVESRIDDGELFEQRGPERLYERIQAAVGGHDADIDTDREKIKTKAESLFADPFDQSIRRQLLRPTTRFINQRVMNVETADDKRYNRTMWTVSIASEDPDSSIEFEETYPTKTVVGQSPSSFRGDYRRTFRNDTHLRNDVLHAWFEISRRWIDQYTVVRGYSDTDLLDDSPDDYRWCESRTNTFHLCSREDNDPVCHSSLSEVNSTYAFEFDRLPAATTICPHCSEHVKRLRVDRTLRGDW